VSNSVRRDGPTKLPLALGTCGVPPNCTASKSGGGLRSCLELEAANAIASGPYGTPNLAMESRLEMSFSCSGVGPAFGYVNSDLISVCVRGAEIELTEIKEGEFMRSGSTVTFERGRVKVRKGVRTVADGDCLPWPWSRPELVCWP
jgi:hypothetical protein